MIFLCPTSILEFPYNFIVKYSQRFMKVKVSALFSLAMKNLRSFSAGTYNHITVKKSFARMAFSNRNVNGFGLWSRAMLICNWPSFFLLASPMGHRLKWSDYAAIPSFTFTEKSLLMAFRKLFVSDTKYTSVFQQQCHAHIVWKLLKMSHLNFWILAFSTNFCLVKTDLSGNTVWPQASGFQKLAKMNHFCHF